MEKENIKAFMLYNINESIDVKECIKSGIAITFLSVLSFYFRMGNTVFLIAGILPILIYSLAVFKLKKGDVIEGVHCLLLNGIWAVCSSFIFALISIEIVFITFDENERAGIIGIIIIGYIVVFLLYRYIIRKNIEKNVYGGEKEKIKGLPFFTAFGLLGLSVGKIFLPGMDEKSASKLGCILLQAVSYLCLMGVFNIFKYKYLMEHKELLEDLNTDKKGKQKAETGEHHEPKTNKRKHQNHRRR